MKARLEWGAAASSRLVGWFPLVYATLLSAASTIQLLVARRQLDPPLRLAPA